MAEFICVLADFERFAKIKIPKAIEFRWNEIFLENRYHPAFSPISGYH
jgi:hypothetical protein